MRAHVVCRSFAPGRSNSKVVLGALSILSTTACSGAPASPTGAFAGQVRDSAGIEIVEHSNIPEDLPVWRVAEAPEVRIGAIDGTGPDVFGRISGIVGLGDGTIVIADAQAMELRAFDPQGRHLWSAGRSGGGPGEFSNGIVRLLRLPGDSLLATDVGRRAHLFSSDGSFVRAMSLDPPREGLSQPSVVGALLDGSFLAQAATSLPDPSTDALERGYRRGEMVLLLHNLAATESRELGSFPGSESHLEFTQSPGGELSSVSILRTNMGRTTVHAVGDSTVVVGTQDRFGLRYYDDAGALASIIRVGVPPVPVTDDIREQAEAHRPGLPLPDTLPAFGDILIDDAERVWVEEFVPTYDEDRVPRWWVIDREGSIVAEVTMPAGFVPYAVARETVMGVSLDDLDVPYVERRSITRP